MKLGALARDQAARLFLYRGELSRNVRTSDAGGDDRTTDRIDLYREWLAYGSDTKRIVESFVAGINAYVTLIETRNSCSPEAIGTAGAAMARPIIMGSMRGK